MNLIEKCGKTAFFRSGPEPLILNDEERYERRKQRAEFFKKNRIISSRGHVLLPNLAHTGNYAPIQDDSTGKVCFIKTDTLYIGYHPHQLEPFQ